MDTIEIAAEEYVEYGVLTALVCAASAVPAIPNQNDILEFNGCYVAYEAITATLETLPVHESGTEVRALLAAHIDQMRSILLTRIGGKRGDKATMFAELSARSTEIERAFARMRARLGIDLDMNDGSTAA